MGLAYADWREHGLRSTGGTAGPTQDVADRVTQTPGAEPTELRSGEALLFNLSWVLLRGGYLAGGLPTVKLNTDKGPSKEVERVAL